jgi:transglutaminase-like putative cysteine protease
MPRSFLPLLLFLFVASTALPAQNEPMKYGRVPAEDLALRTYEPDTSASAVVLGDYGTVTFFYRGDDLCHRLVRHRRLKLLRRAAFDTHAAVGIAYDDERQKVLGVKAQVIAPDGRETEVPDQDIFREKATGDYHRLRFTFPNLTEGCVVEYKYTLETDGVFTLPEWYFQEEIPVRYSEIYLEMPRYLNYVTLQQGAKLTKQEAEVIERTMDGLDRGTTVQFVAARYALAGAPALREEPFITTMEDYYTRLRFQLSSVSFPGRPTEQILSTWPKLADELSHHADFGDQFQQKRHYTAAWEAAQPALAAAATPDDRIAALYKFVNATFTVEDGPGITASRSLEQLFEQKRARGHEMNLLLIALLRKAGFTAHPVLVSTRSHGRVVPMYPIFDQFNYVIVAVDGPDGKRRLLDAGNRFYPPGMISVAALNGEGWLVDPENPEWFVLTPPISQDVYVGALAVDAEGVLRGRLQVLADGYSAADRREDLGEDDTEKFWKHALEKRYADLKLDSAVVRDADELPKPLVEEFTLEIPGYAQAANDFIYVSPLPYSGFIENPFKVERRDYPVDVPYPLKERHSITLNVPAGYAVESLPESVRLVLPDNGGRFQYLIEAVDRQIKLNCTISLAQLHFEPAEYDTLRSFFGHIVAKLGEQVVLKKI